MPGSSISWLEESSEHNQLGTMYLHTLNKNLQAAPDSQNLYNMWKRYTTLQDDILDTECRPPGICSRLLQAAEHRK